MLSNLNTLDPTDQMSPAKKMSDASADTPHPRRASLHQNPSTPHRVQQRAKSVPQEAIRSAIGEMQLQPHPPRTTHGAGHRPTGGRVKQGEAMSRLAAPPRRSPRPPQTLSPRRKLSHAPNISVVHALPGSPERADPSPLVLVSSHVPKGVERVKFHPVPPLDPVQQLPRPHRSQANKAARKGVPGKKAPSSSDPSKLTIAVKETPGRRKQEALQLCIPATLSSPENTPDTHASNFSSPYLQAAAGYNYEADDYEVDYEIFSVNPGAKLPLLGVALPSPVPETHRLEEPSLSSRSICRAFNDDLSITAQERKGNTFEVMRPITRESFSLDSTAVVPGVSRLSKEIHAHKVELEIEVPSEGANVIETATGTYSKEGFEDDSFSYGSVGGWDNYVDEDVEGESYDFDEEEINAAEEREKALASSSVLARNAGGGKGTGTGTVPAPGPGGKGHRYNRSMYNEFDTSANTTVCLSSAAIRVIVRNLDEGVEYRDIPICK